MLTLPCPRRRAVLLASILSFALVVPATGQAGPATGTRGMVSSAHPLATEVGLEILAKGGNAFDAAVAVAAALNVVEPMMSGAGGYGTILVYDAEAGRARFLNPSGRIPYGVDSDQYRAPTPGFMENRTGAKAVSTPGNVNAWWAMSHGYGRLAWADVLAPAIELAAHGFEIDERMAAMIARGFDDFSDYTRTFYGRNGRPLRPGERLVQTDLASSLHTIADEGPGALHGGSIGRRIDAAMREAGGFLRLEDLARNEAEWWDPIAIDYRGHRVVTASPPANSFPALIRLGMMSRYDVTAMGDNSVAYLHHFAEVTKHAFWTRLRWAGDPDIAPPPLDVLLSKVYWEGQTAAIDDHRARDFVPPRPVTPTGLNTTHYVVADAWGNVVSATQTLGNLFGSRIMPEGTGIFLNNSLAYSTFEPKGNPMDAYPGRRKLSGDVPLFVMRDGKPWIVIGTPGGHTIAQTVPQIVMNMIDFGMDVQAAIAAPRIAFAEPNELLVEVAVPDSVAQGLMDLGHHVRIVPGIGNAHGLTVEYGPEGAPVRFTGGADPRGAGLAKGR